MSDFLSKALRHVIRFVPINGLRIVLLRMAGVEVGSGVRLAWGSLIGRGASIGSGCAVASGCVIGNGVQLRSQVRVARGASIYEATIGDAVIVGAHARINRVRVGPRSHVETDVLCTGFRDGWIEVGHDTYIGIGAVLDWSAGLAIGNYVHIAGPGTALWTHSSILQALCGEQLDDHKHKLTRSIRIEDHVWIGGHCTIYPGVTVAHHSVILPNSAVNASTHPNTLVGGVPARYVRSISRDGDTWRFEE